MCQFIESIRVENGEAKLLSLHQKRVNATYSFHRKSSHLSLDGLLSEIEIPSNGLYKWRIVYDLNGEYSVEIQDYHFSKIKTFKIIEAPELEYSMKSLDRTAFQNLKNQVNADEIIITQNGKITDTSFSNLVFKKENLWYTPKTFLLNGVMRQHLLETDQIKECDISIQDLHQYEGFQLINAMRPLLSGVFYEMATLQGDLSTK